MADVREGPYVTYGSGLGFGCLAFERVCPTCGLFVVPDEVVMVANADGQPHGVNAECVRCGRVEMPFVGYLDGEGVESD